MKYRVYIPGVEGEEIIIAIGVTLSEAEEYYQAPRGSCQYRKE